MMEKQRDDNQTCPATTILAVTAPELAAFPSGGYLEDCAVSDPSANGTFFSGVLDYVLDTKIADQLWARTEQLIARDLTI